MAWGTSTIFTPPHLTTATPAATAATPPDPLRAMPGSIRGGGFGSGLSLASMMSGGGGGGAGAVGSEPSSTAYAPSNTNAQGQPVNLANAFAGSPYAQWLQNQQQNQQQQTSLSSILQLLQGMGQGQVNPSAQGNQPVSNLPGNWGTQTYASQPQGNPATNPNSSLNNIWNLHNMNK